MSPLSTPSTIHGGPSARVRLSGRLKEALLEVAVLSLLLAAATAVAVLPVLAGVWRHLQ
ncbi:hypothetical protein RB623_06030 [Mesorhizobium sp. LHD-90]|uniref:hypothetical protein n=1 Tax=Mesorhizobium sp. LHD-90 TaxID=3071414 RepID=UPI0027DF3037|nr:hypothetical protein [Mesorhizobium sp. LHD-90]MDQ6433608.1 hypothetical protein [Mesorhizobium sp. LHD-90]